MKVDGGCHCGNIRYEADVDPTKVVICHCTDCQTLSGSAFRTVAPTEAGTFRLLSGAPKIYVKTAQSGNRRAQAFCGDCGTPLYATSPDNPAVYGVRLGCVDERAELAPSKQLWTRSSMPWLHNLTSVPGVSEQ